MKVALLSTYDIGGAGRATVRLNEALNEVGIESKIFVKEKKKINKNVSCLEKQYFNNPIFSYINKNYFLHNRYFGNTILSLMYSSSKLDFLQKLNGYDIINFHWISEFISLEAMVALEQMGKGLVWTLHDQHPMTGACHYTHGCYKYEIDCDNCPQMKENQYNFPHEFLKERIKYLPQNIVVVTPSNWLAECAKKSNVFKKHRIEVISNSLNLSIFQNHVKEQAKSSFGIEKNKKVILFGAENHSERRKGFKQLLDSMQYLKNHTLLARYIQNNQVVILLFGIVSEEIKELGIPYVSTGYIVDDTKLAMAYSAADVVALPSLEDNLPNIMLEAMACGTPVVGFETGGMPDSIINNETGAIVPLGDTIAFAEALSNILLNKDLGLKCRQFAQRCFSYKNQAESYKNLYIDILGKKQTKYYAKNTYEGMFPETAVVLAPYICETMERVSSFDEIEMQRFLYGNAFEKKIMDMFVNKRFDFLSCAKKSIAIWGTGSSARTLLNSMKENNSDNLKCICGFFDGKKKNVVGKIFEKYNLLQIDSIQDYQLDAIIIAALDYEDEIYNEIKYLEKIGIKIIKLLEMYLK